MYVCVHVCVCVYADFNLNCLSARHVHVEEVVDAPGCAFCLYGYKHVYAYVNAAQTRQRSYSMCIADMTQRCRNNASTEDIVQAMRGNSKAGPSHSVLTDVNVEHVIAGLGSIVCDILSTTNRPTKKILFEAAKSAWDLEQGTADLFAVRVIAAVSYCRLKERQSTSMNKLSPAVANIVQKLR